jgi:acetyl-CoA carboxylase biotin carboxyl carrier protein
LDLKEIKQIVDLMKRNGLTEFEIEENDFKLRLCRKNGDAQMLAPAATTGSPFPAAQPPTAEGADKAAPATPAKDAGRVIKSPMVGTFFVAPTPDSSPFVRPGDAIDPDTVVCIIEAMKVMNEIKAEISGTVTEVLVKNGDSVEFGQALFRVR